MRFPKPVELYGVLKFFGSNIVTSEFDEWKPHRKVAAPAFSEVRGYHLTAPGLTNNGSQKNNKLAFEASVRAVTSLFEGEWVGRQEIIVDDALHLTMTVSSSDVVLIFEDSLTFLYSLLLWQSPLLASGIK